MRFDGPRSLKIKQRVHCLVLSHRELLASITLRVTISNARIEFALQVLCTEFSNAHILFGCSIPQIVS